MMYSDRDVSQDAIANLNSTSPLTFSQPISAEDLTRDLDLFTNMKFFDFDFGGSSTTFTSPLDSNVSYRTVTLALNAIHKITCFSTRTTWTIYPSLCSLTVPFVVANDRCQWPLHDSSLIHGSLPVHYITIGWFLYHDGRQ